MADFPRGGGSSLTPLEAQRIRDSAMQDVLFGVSVMNHYKTDIRMAEISPFPGLNRIPNCLRKQDIV